MYYTFDPKKAWECQSTGARSLSCLCADPSLRSLLPAPPLLRAAVGLPCLPRSLLGVGGRRSRRGRVARETSACVWVGACQRAREGVPNWKPKNTHARLRFTQTFNHSGRVAGHRKEPRKPPYRRGKLRSFFSSVVVAAVSRRALPRGGFTGRNRIVASPAETPLIRRGKRGHKELKASLFFFSPTHLLYSPDSPFSSGLGCGGFRIPLTFFFFFPCEKFITRLGDETAENVHAEV